MSKHIEIAKKEHKKRAETIKMAKPQEFDNILKKMAESKPIKENKSTIIKKYDKKSDK
jgi:hypothetical protein